MFKTFAKFFESNANATNATNQQRMTTNQQRMGQRKQWISIRNRFVDAIRIGVTEVLTDMFIVYSEAPQ